MKKENKMISITEIQIIPVKPSNGLVAFCSFVLFESIYCCSVAIFTRPGGGLRLVYPTKKLGVKEINIFHPLTNEVGTMIEQEVTLKYYEVMNYGRFCMPFSEGN